MAKGFKKNKKFIPTGKTSNSPLSSKDVQRKEQRKSLIKFCKAFSPSRKRFCNLTEGHRGKHVFTRKR